MLLRIFRHTFVVSIFLGFTTMVSAQVMQSTNYRIQDDSVNVGGGFSSSAGYQLENTTGEIATGESTSTNYAMNAGYQQMHESYLALTAPSNVTMSPSLGGVTGGISDGSTSLTATTDNYAGYQMTITASSTPAMKSGTNSISDYSPSGANPDFNFSVSSGQALFAFSPEGTDIASRYRDDGATCDVGSSDTAGACWDGLSTTPITIATRSSANHPSGTVTTIQFKVGIGSSVIQAAGTYVATTTVTLLAL